MKHFVPLIVLFCSTSLKADVLIVGLIPDEEVNISGTSTGFDTVWVTGDGILTVSNSDFTINSLLIVDSDATFSVVKSKFTLKGTAIFYGNSKSMLMDSLQFACNLNAGGNAALEIDSAYVDYSMHYMGQYQLNGFDSAQVSVSNSDIQFATGKLGGGFIGKARFHQSNTDYHSSLGVSVTTGLNQGSSFISENCTGGFELIVTDSCQVALENTSSLIVWFSFEKGDSADFSFPATDTQMIFTGSVPEFHLADTVKGISGINFDVSIYNCSMVYWCIFQGENSYVHLSNSTLLACGETFGTSTNEILKNFINDSTYTFYSPSFADRYLTLSHSRVFAWNYYVFDSATVHIEDCLFGEVLVYGNGTVYLENSICDGSGGYVGAYDNGILYITNAQIFRNGAGPAILLTDNNGYVKVTESDITGDIILNGNSTLLLGNTHYNAEPLVNDASFLMDAFLDQQDTFLVNTASTVSGTLTGTKGVSSTEYINRYKIGYSLPDGSGRTLIFDSSGIPDIRNGELCSWDVPGLTPGDYLLWLTCTLTNDTSLTIYRKVCLDRPLSGCILQSNPVVRIYPNPFKDFLNFSFEKTASESIDIFIYDMKGRVVFRKHLKNSQLSDTSICTKQLQKGNYLCSVVQNRETVYSVIVIK